MNNTDLKAHLAEEVKKHKGIYVPIKAGILERAAVRWVACSRLHPNPDDEFCKPDIGPHEGIISGYVAKFREERRHTKDYCEEPLAVEKIRPSGYMILNGHHRWAAAMRLNYPKIPVRIVNLTNETDIRKMLQNSRNNRRVTLDLDEVCLRPEGDSLAEPPLSFPFRKIYRERLRLGIPGLLHYLSTKGYDVWVYSAQYYSVEYIRNLFRHYHVPVTGIVTGTARKTKIPSEKKAEIDKLITTKYLSTIHIDNHMVLRTISGSADFDEIALQDCGPGWSREVMEAIERLERDEK